MATSSLTHNRVIFHPDKSNILYEIQGRRDCRKTQPAVAGACCAIGDEEAERITAPLLDSYGAKPFFVKCFHVPVAVQKIKLIGIKVY